MGDRTWCRVYCRTKDQARFERELDMGSEFEPDEDDEAKPYAELWDEERIPCVDAPKGKPYLFQHGSHYSYSASEAASTGKRYSEWSQGEDGGYIVLHFGTPEWKEEAKALRRHIALVRKVRKMLGMPASE